MTESMQGELTQITPKVLWDEPLSRYTSLRVGGGADALVSPRTVEEVAGLIQFSRRNKIPIFVLGSGSNLIVRDKGIRGLVLSLREGFSELRLEEGEILYVEAGVGIPRLIDFCCQNGLGGAEPLVGIPGCLGGALVMNAGTPEGEIGSLVQSVTFIDREGKLQTATPSEIRFGYRESHFPRGSIILSARLKTKRVLPAEIQERVKRLREKRIKTQPLNTPNVGSIFKNPKNRFAAALIDDAGLKGVRVGGARVSFQHANFIVNEGSATAKDILSLVGLIKDKVKEKFGVGLELEAQVVGEE